MEKIYIDTNKLQEEITNLKNEKEKLSNLKIKIKNNYDQLKNVNMEGKFISEIDNNYDYGLEITENLIERLDTQIQKIEYAFNQYMATIKEIETKVGDKNV